MVKAHPAGQRFSVRIVLRLVRFDVVDRDILPVAFLHLRFQTYIQSGSVLIRVRSVDHFLSSDGKMLKLPAKYDPQQFLHKLLSNLRVTHHRAKQKIIEQVHLSQPLPDCFPLFFCLFFFHTVLLSYGAERRACTLFTILRDPPY